MHTRLSFLRDKARRTVTDKPVSRRSLTLSAGQALSLRQGDITEEETGAIVNAANEGLAHGGGVAGAIVRKGGYAIQDESDRIGRVATGFAAITGGGRLAARYVIHAVGPVWRGRDTEENDRLLASATTAALEIARAKKIQSIAFPAISSGIFGFPKDRCATVMLQAVQDWARLHPDALPNDIRFTIIDSATVAHFEREWDTVFGSAGSTTDPDTGNVS